MAGLGAVGAVEAAGGVAGAGAGVALPDGAGVLRLGDSGSVVGAGAGAAGAGVVGEGSDERPGADSGSIGFLFSSWMRFSRELAFFCVFEFTAVITMLVVKKTAARNIVVRTSALAAPRPEIRPPVPPPPMPKAPPSERWSITAITIARQAIR